MIVVAGMSESSQVPRFQPARVPRVMPMRKVITVETPTSTRVQGRDWPITWETGVGK